MEVSWWQIALEFGWETFIGLCVINMSRRGNSWECGDGRLLRSSVERLSLEHALSISCEGGSGS